MLAKDRAGPPAVGGQRGTERGFSGDFLISPASFLLYRLAFLFVAVVQILFPAVSPSFHVSRVFVVAIAGSPMAVLPRQRWRDDRGWTAVARVLTGYSGARLRPRYRGRGRHTQREAQGWVGFEFSRQRPMQLQFMLAAAGRAVSAGAMLPLTAATCPAVST